MDKAGPIAGSMASDYAATSHYLVRHSTLAHSLLGSTPLATRRMRIERVQWRRHLSSASGPGNRPLPPRLPYLPPSANCQLPIATVHNKQNILFNIVACCIAYIPLWPTYIPWLPSLHHWRDVIRFGISSLFTNCLAATNHSIPDILLGKLGNATQVGFSAGQTRP